MKKLLLLLCTLLLLSGCVQSYDGPTVEKRVLLTQEDIYISGDLRKVDSCTEYRYDTFGNLVSYRREQYGYVDVGYYQYDGEGREICETVLDYKGIFPILNHRTYTSYDEEGRVLVKEVHRLWPQEDTTYTFTYSERKHTVDIDGPSGIVYPRESYFDEAGRLIRSVWPDGEETLYSYDEDGRQISDSGAPPMPHKEYDEEARTETHYHGNGRRTVYHFNEFGTTDYSQTFDESGDLIHESRNYYGIIQVPAKEEAP